MFSQITPITVYFYGRETRGNTKHTPHPTRLKHANADTAERNARAPR